MELHKSHWIAILDDDENTTKVKRKFIADLGFENADDARNYLVKAEQTTFVGGWFLTDEELVAERKAREENKMSVFSAPYPSEDGRIVVLKDEVAEQFDEPEFKALAAMFEDMGDKTPECLNISLRRLKKIIAWATEDTEEFDDSITQIICETLLELTKIHAGNRRITIVLIELMGAFIEQKETKEAPAPFYVKTIGEA